MVNCRDQIQKFIEIEKFPENLYDAQSDQPVARDPHVTIRLFETHREITLLNEIFINSL